MVLSFSVPWRLKEKEPPAGYAVELCNAGSRLYEVGPKTSEGLACWYCDGVVYGELVYDTGGYDGCWRS